MRYRTKLNKPNRFCDDLGPWDSEKGTTSKVFYLLTDNLKLIYKKNSEYCISKGKKKTCVPIEPQPDDKDVVIMNRYYCTLKRQNTYKKRVTWFSSASDENLSKVAVVEYIGVLEQLETVHGNSKRNNVPYKRTNPYVMEHAAKELAAKEIAAKKPRQVYKEMVLIDKANAPKDIQQLRDLKHRNEKKTKTTTGNNIADEVLQVLSMLNDNNFVQKVEHAKGQLSSIIYSEEHIIDFQKFIDNSDSTRVGIDRTFNLGCFYVTAFVYKSHGVVRKDTFDHPTILISSCHQISISEAMMKRH
jgi:hypothetical protein